MNILTLAVAAAGVVVGAAAGFLGRNATLKRTLLNGQARQKEIILEAKNEALKIKEEAEEERKRKEEDLKELEQELRNRSTGLDRRTETLDKSAAELQTREATVEQIKKGLEEAKSKQEVALAKIAHLKKEEAKKLLLDQVEREFKDEIIQKIRDVRATAREEAEIEARKIISTVIGRIAAEHAAENTTMSVALPSEEMKGRIIGKEGRNIQVFEKVTGVDLVVDETPDTVLISSFDPVRRYTAKLALERLIVDGRIHPARIEEIVGKVKTEVSRESREAGEAAVYELGITGFHPDLIKILGTLKFRTSYGQNVLRHSIEVAHLANLLAAEIGADQTIVKKAAILHDIGKAVSHEVAGGHHHISGDIARKYGMSEAVIHAIMAHHDDVEPKTVEAIVVKAADAISGARPGARRESLESYITRLRDLENITNSFEGVEKSYAIQAGREVRIIVKPTEIDDLGAIKLSKNIAKKIEQDMQYPGTIKVNVIRETRAVEYAK